MAKYFVPLVATPPLNNGGGGSDLPAVSAADNGDVLTVVNGVWDKAAPGGGGSSVLVVTITYDNDSEKYMADKTAGEMYSAYCNGIVLLKELDGTDEYYYSVFSAAKNSAGYMFTAPGELTFTAQTASDYPLST